MTARFTTLRVSNYRSLGDDVRLDFNDFTALVGSNGSGKSNVLDALSCLCSASPRTRRCALWSTRSAPSGSTASTRTT